MEEDAAARLTETGETAHHTAMVPQTADAAVRHTAMDPQTVGGAVFTLVHQTAHAIILAHQTAPATTPVHPKAPATGNKEEVLHTEAVHRATAHLVAALHVTAHPRAGQVLSHQALANIGKLQQATTQIERVMPF